MNAHERLKEIETELNKFKHIIRKNSETHLLESEKEGILLGLKSGREDV